MGIERVRRWHWLAISVLAGLLVAEVRRALPRPLSDYGSQLSDQKTFESALVREYQGRRLFRDLVVYPVEVNEAGRRSLKHFVAGSYFSGTPRKEGGRWRAEWEPYCFVATVPFKPMTAGEAEDPARRVARAMFESSRRTGGRAPQEIPSTAPSTAPAAAPDSPQTVMDYLEQMSRDHGVAYTYAWWHHPRWQRAAWVTGSFVLVGLVWPTCVNLLVFGTFRRPPEQRGPGLWEALREIGRRRPAAPAPAPAAAGNGDVEAYDAALEAQLAATAAESAEADPIAAAGVDVPPPRALPAAPAEPAAVTGPHEEHHYEAKKDDFYPTEKKPVHHP